uniref:TauD/TfdA-like domain-containing protein n=1 Tax=Octopus bimaculoides TaxID=37653 RepID=A0A0L8HFX0_OCTBM
MAVVADYTFLGGIFEMTDPMKKDFDEHGYFIVRGLINEEELQKIHKTLTESELCSHAYGVDDDAGGKSRMTLWSFPGNDVTGMLARCNKIAGTSEKLLGGEVYFYHGKLMMKDAFSGGRHVWHQDYGYWYNNGCLTPDLLTVYVALDKCTKENGCLQVSNYLFPFIFYRAHRFCTSRNTGARSTT